jgi:hypothetical protein
MVRRLLNILFENYAKKYEAILCFVYLVTSIGRLKRRTLRIAVRIHRSSAYLPAYSKGEEVLLLIQI